MPYIPVQERVEVDEEIDTLCDHLEAVEIGADVGTLNYIITRIIDRFTPINTYSDLNEVIGVLECVKQEYYRRRIAPYEDAKCNENGDVYGQ